MRKKINGKLCDTESATLLGTKCVGEFGHTDGYEEKLYVTKTKQHFMYGIGGPDSKYPKETMNLLTDTEAEYWNKENNISPVKSVPKKAAVTKKKEPVKKKDAAPKKKETTKKTKNSEGGK